MADGRRRHLNRDLSRRLLLKVPIGIHNPAIEGLNPATSCQLPATSHEEDLPLMTDYRLPTTEYGPAASGWPLVAGSWQLS